MSFLHDLHVSFIWRPVPLFPILGGYSDGVFGVFNGFIGGHLGFVSFIQRCFLRTFQLVLTVFIALYLCSMISGFVYRYNRLHILSDMIQNHIFNGCVYTRMVFKLERLTYNDSISYMSFGFNWMDAIFQLCACCICSIKNFVGQFFVLFIKPYLDVSSASRTF